MSPANKMSHEEIRKQGETIAAIGDNSSELVEFVRRVRKLWPYLTVACTLIGMIIGSTISVYVWNQSLVKQEQFSRHEQREIARDSTLNAKIDTIDSRKVSTSELKNIIVASKFRGYTERWINGKLVLIPSYKLNN